ncbi:molybdate ABC transporter substrate-binding protein [Kitasatospora sp. NPDC096147]|uniref:molybdate ABC transporter substrate-binding protein n=1 Tax=Kitasatospora sp. NPDC096147 TaxID=3364093 RepID=UPI00382BFF30
MNHRHPTLLGLSSMAVRPLLDALTATLAAAGLPVRFEAAGGVETARRIRAGARADLAVLAHDALTALHRDGLLATVPLPLWDSDTVAAVPAAHPARPLDSPADLRTLLLSATAVAHSTGPSGTALLALVGRLGLTGRLTLRQTPPGVPVAALLADGTADLAFQQQSELAGHPGVRLLGRLPGDTAITSTFSAAVLATAPDPERARRLLPLLAADGASARAHGLRPSTGTAAPGPN